jgi:hypothetical protein
VIRDTAPKALLDSYKADRRPVGVKVMARTRAAIESYGRKPSGKRDSLANM